MPALPAPGAGSVSVTAPKGFVAAGVHCGIRKGDRRDLAIVRSLERATGAGMFTINRVQGTDAAEVALFEDRATGRAIVICALDNLGKGAAGQAVQNANLALGLDETAGVRLSGVLV